MQGGGYDQGFHEIRMKSTRFHMKSAGFHEIHRISREIRWNPADFMWNRKTSCKEL